MAFKHHNPPTVSLTGKYSHGLEVPPGLRTLWVSGQVGVDGKGKILPGIDRQCEQAWKNIGAVLKSAGMGYKDIVKIVGFLTDSRYIPAYRGARDKFLSEPWPASTLLIVEGLAAPEMLVEIEVVACKA